MALFTVIVEYRGGTYVAQHRAASPTQALVRWIEKFPRIRGSFIGARSRLKLRAALSDSDDKPVALDGATNVWFWSSAISHHIVAHVIRTEVVQRVGKPASFRKKVG
jgi:hypothetical protein